MKSSRSVADLQQEIDVLKSQALALKKSQNQLVQDASLAKIRERKLLDDLRRAQSAAPERRGKEQREIDEMNEALQSELARVRKRNSTLQEQLRKFADSGGKKTPRLKKKTPRLRSNENIARPEDVQRMLDRIGEKLVNTEKMISSHHHPDERQPEPRHPELSPAPLRTNQELADLKTRLRESQTKVLILEKQYEQIEAAMQAGRQVQRSAIDQVDRYKALLADANARHKHAQNRVKELEFYQDKVESMKLEIEDLQATNANLQTQVDTLMKSAFLGDQAEANRLRAIETEHLSKLNELRAIVLQRDADLETSTKKLSLQTDKIKSLEESLKESAEERDRLSRESIKAQSKIRDLQDRIDVFTTDSGVNFEDLDRALDMIRRQGKKGSNGPSGLPTIASLQRQIRDLEILNKDLVTEVKNKDDMIRLQTHLHSELDASYNRLQTENNQLKKALIAEQKQAAMRPRAESVLSDLSLLSQLSTVSFSGSNNVIAVRVVSATLSRTCPSFADGSDPLTFVTIDFFDFETCYSGVFGGFDPNYKLTAQFKTETDDYLISYLQKDSMNIDLYQQTSRGDADHIARCRVPLAELLGFSRRIRRSFPAMDVVDPSRQVATLEIVAKMYRPVVSATPSVAESVHDSLPDTQYTMQMTATLLSVPLEQSAFSAVSLRVYNMYYDLDEEAERISSPSAPVLVFSFGFQSKHDRILPHESIEMRLLGDGFTWSMDLSLSEMSKSLSGQYETDLAITNDQNVSVGTSSVRIDWSLIEQKS